MTRDGCGPMCCRGLYSCHWKHPRGRRPKRSCCWPSVVSGVCLLSLCWMYVCLTTFNDREEVNWKAFSGIGLWVNWFLVLIILFSLLTVYFLLLLVLVLFQLAMKEPLDMHCVHKVFLSVGVVFMALGTVGISLFWTMEWKTVLLSFQATAPFLQLGGVGALTLVSWMVFKGFHRAHRTACKVSVMAVFLCVSVTIFLSPLLIQSPCLMEPKQQLPPKPDLIGHRGAPMLAPENTLMSFQRSLECGVIAFETDVQLSKNGVPFLMHDNNSHFLRRTTDVLQKFPGKEFNCSTNLSWEELQRLNAGDWFLKTDPFRSVSQLSEQEKEAAGNQSIPSLRQLLELSKTHNISIIFDLKNDPKKNNVIPYIVETILTSEIPQELILWLPSEQREDVKKNASRFKQVYSTVSDMDKDRGDHLNIKYSLLSTSDMRSLRSRNVSVNLWVVNERWLFSLAWCMGASSVTTNACPLLRDMTRPVWTMDTKTYMIIWITVDLGSLLIMFSLFICQWCCYRHSEGKEKQRKEFSVWKEVSPFLHPKHGS